MATSRRTKPSGDGGKSVNLGRHAAECKICAHANRLEIEQEFVGWAGANQIAKTYGIIGSRPRTASNARLAGELRSRC